MKLDRILVPLDGSPLAEKALLEAMPLLSARPGATLILMRATQVRTRRPWADPIEAQIEAVTDAEAYLRRVADRLRADDPEWTVTTSVWYGPPAHAIADAADARDAQLIVMSTGGPFPESSRLGAAHEEEALGV